MNVLSSISGGVRRAASTTGVVLAAAYAVLGVLAQLLVLNLAVPLVDDADVPVEGLGTLTVDAPQSLLVGGLVATGLALALFNVVAVRSLAGDETGFRAEYATRNVAWVVLNSVLAGLALLVVTVAGLFFLVVPGIVSYVAFFFAPFVVAVDDVSFVAAFRESWRLTRGNWLSLVALFVVPAVVASVIVLPASMALALTPLAASGSHVTAWGLQAVINAPVSVLLLGVWAEAFSRLRAGRPLDR